MSLPATDQRVANDSSGREYGRRTETVNLRITNLAAAFNLPATFRREGGIIYAHFGDVPLQAFGAAASSALADGVPAWAQPQRNASFVYTRKRAAGGDLSVYGFIGGQGPPTGANPGQVRLFGTTAGGDITAGEQWGAQPFSISYPAGLAMGNFVP